MRQRAARWAAMPTCSDCGGLPVPGVFTVYPSKLMGQTTSSQGSVGRK